MSHYNCKILFKPMFPNLGMACKHCWGGESNHFEVKHFPLKGETIYLETYKEGHKI